MMIKGWKKTYIKDILQSQVKTVNMYLAPSAGVNTITLNQTRVLKMMKRNVICLC